MAFSASALAAMTARFAVASSSMVFWACSVSAVSLFWAATCLASTAVVKASVKSISSMAMETMVIPYSFMSEEVLSAI